MTKSMLLETRSPCYNHYVLIEFCNVNVAFQNAAVNYLFLVKFSGAVKNM